MRFNSLKEWAKFFQEDILTFDREVVTQYYQLYGIRYSFSQLKCDLHSSDGDLFVFANDKIVKISIYSLCVGDIDITDERFIQDRTIEKIINYLNNKFSTVGELTLEEI